MTHRSSKTLRRERHSATSAQTYAPHSKRYAKGDGAVGLRPQKAWPKWYRISRCEPGELLGSLHEEWRRCGKGNCRCASGDPGDRHGPYWVRRWRDASGEQRKQYVRGADLAEVREAIEARRARLTEERERRLRHMRRGEHSWKACHGKATPVPGRSGSAPETTDSGKGT